MKQIVFLIGALVVLLQLHSTTAAIDLDGVWDKVESLLWDNTGDIKDWANDLENNGVTAWQKAKAEIPARAAKLKETLKNQLDKSMTQFSRVIANERKTSSIEWAKIKPKIDEEMARISLAFKETTKKIADAASGTKQEIADSVAKAIEELTNVIKTATVNTVNNLKEAAQKKSNAEKTTADSQSGWNKVEAVILDNTGDIKDWVNDLEHDGESAWKNAKADIPEKAAELQEKLTNQLDKSMTQFSRVIADERKTSSIEWAKIKPKIDEAMATISLAFKETSKKIVDAALGTKQEIADSVAKAIEVLLNVIKTATVNTVNNLKEAAQKESDAEEPATDSQKGWDDIESHFQANIEEIKNWMKKLKEMGESVWNDGNVKIPEKWAQLGTEFINLADEVATKLSAEIAEHKKTSSVKWAEIQEQITEQVARVYYKLRESLQKIVDGVSGTEQEINEIVDQILEELKKLIEIETALTEKIMNEAAQKKSDAEQTADGQENQKNE